MKRIFVLLIMCVPFMVFAQKANLSFETTSHNFGFISEKAGKVAWEFKFKNTGKAPLILTNVRSGCGCTTPEWSRKPVAPGESGSVKVIYDPRNRPGAFIKSITVNSNASNPVVSLTVRGNVSRTPLGPYENYKYAVGPVKFTTDLINLGVVKNTWLEEKTIELVNTSKQPVTVQVNSSSPALSVRIAPGTLEKGQKGMLILQYDPGKKNDWGFVKEDIQVTVNGQKQGNIQLTAHIQEDFSVYEEHPENAPTAVFSEKEVMLEGLEKNTSYTHEFYIQNTGKSDLIIRKLKTSDENVSIKVIKSVIRPGKKVKALVTFKTGDNPEVIKIVQFTVNDPQASVITYKLTGILK